MLAWQRHILLPNKWQVVIKKKDRSSGDVNDHPTWFNDKHLNILCNHEINDEKPYKRHSLTLQPWYVKFKSIVLRQKN